MELTPATEALFTEWQEATDPAERARKAELFAAMVRAEATWTGQRMNFTR